MSSFPTDSVRIEYAYPTSDLGGRAGAFIVYCGDDCREFPTIFPVNLGASSYSDAAKATALRVAEECAVEWALSLDRPVDAAFIEIAFGSAERADRWRSRGIVHSLDVLKASKPAKGGAL